MPDAAAGTWLPVSISQDMRLASEWVAGLQGGHRQPFHVVLCLVFHGRPDVDCVQHALDRVVQRHSALRTEFEPLDTVGTTRARQIFRTLQSPDGWAGCLFHHRVTPAAALALQSQRIEGPISAANPAFAALVLSEASRRFDYSEVPCARARLIEADEGRQALLVVFHHLIADGLSVRIFIDDWAASYRELAHGAARAGIPPEAAPYSQFATWQREAMLSPAALSELANLQREHDDAIERQPCFPAASHADDSSVGCQIVSVEIDSSDSADIRTYCRASGVTLFPLCLAAVHQACVPFCDGTSVPVWSVWSNRLAEWTRGMFGWLAERRLIDVCAPPGPSDAQWVQALQRRTAKLADSQHVPAGAVEYGTWSQRPSVPKARAARGISLNVLYRDAAERIALTEDVAVSVLRLPFTSRDTGLKINVRAGDRLHVDAVFHSAELSTERGTAVLHDIVGALQDVTRRRSSRVEAERHPQHMP